MMKMNYTKNNKGEMTLVAHIQELRKRVIISLAFIFIGGIIGYFWYGTGISFIPPLGEILRGPYCSLPSELRADVGGNGECRLLATKPFDMFLLRFKIGIIAGTVISSPIWVSQIWAFIAPGLYKNEKRFSILLVSFGTLLFTGGAILAYFTLSQGLEFLLGVGKKFQVAAINGTDYYQLLRNFVILFGISFEIPLMVVSLNHFGILKYSAISGKRRIIWVSVFIAGAIFSPGQEAISMLALSFSLGILLEFSFLYCMINDRHKIKKLSKDISR